MSQRFVESIRMEMMAKSFALLLFSPFWAVTWGHAQTPGQAYSGARISVFDFKVLQTRGNTVSLKCRIANTGREENTSPTPLFVELDTANIPAILWGNEEALAKAAKAGMPKLKPGEISSPIWLKVTVHAPPSPSGQCPDLVIDTAYIVHYSEADITLRFELLNKGNAPVEVSGKSSQLGINVYFISGTKLTRGAIPAGKTMIMVGRETLTGWLRPDQKLSGEVVIDLKNRTKFAPNLLLELAPPPALVECDRTNNTRCVEVRY